MVDIVTCPEWLKEMPKTDLHCHLGGSVRLDTVLELASNYGIQLPATDRDKLRSEIVYKDKQDKSLASYIKGIKVCESVLIRPEAFQRAAYEICEDAHTENVRVLELRFAPTNYVHDSLRLHDVVESTLDGLRKGAKKFNMLTGLIICGIKSDMKSVREAAEVAVNYQDYGVVGFDLAGREKGYPPKMYREVIMPVLHNFLPVTIHAGEEDTVSSIAEAIIHLNARRIGHAVTLRESTKLVEYANKTRLGLEICL
ncbi:MAG: adenosine deaminase, partial [Candidatus Woesearchaeota archaeon]